MAARERQKEKEKNVKDLCIFSLISGRYRHYADLFKLCAMTAYPEYDVVFQVSDVPRDAVSTTFFTACERYLMELRTYKYVYITDIDMMIMRETPTLLDFHLAEIENTGLPYSNVPRWHEPMGENRLTGLHFVTNAWWDITKKARDEERRRLYAGEIGNMKCDDELMLMRIVKNSGLAVPPNSELLCRHHGIHLGTYRDYKPKGLQSLKAALS